MAGYVTSSVEEKESGTGFEFTRRKKWPQILLQELVGTSLFCLKPYQAQRNSIDSAGRPTNNNNLGWKSTELENRDFFDLVYPADQPLLYSFFSSLLHPPSGETSMSSSTSSTGVSGTSGSGRSQATYARIQSSDGSGPIAWEIRAHATGIDNLPSGFAGAGGYRLDGTVIPRPSQDEGSLKGKAVWIMGRRVGAGPVEESQSLDAFLELKLENEKLREELRELQHEIDDEDFQAARSYVNPITLDAPSPTSTSPTPSSPSASSSASERLQKEKKKPVKPPKDFKDRGGEKKRPKKSSGTTGAGRSGTAGGSGAGTGGAGGKEGGEGLHVCVTCGRTDSPEWRKGPLGPKTLCNACGLRWAKRNSTQPSRKEKKAAEAANAKR